VEEPWQHPQPKDETACQGTEVNKNQLARHKKVGFTALVSSSSFNIPLSWTTTINFAQEQVSYYHLLELESRSVIIFCRYIWVQACRIMFVCYTTTTATATVAATPIARLFPEIQLYNLLTLSYALENCQFKIYWD
jgi:hypothetical protein